MMNEVDEFIEFWASNSASDGARMLFLMYDAELQRLAELKSMFTQFFVPVFAEGRWGVGIPPERAEEVKALDDEIHSTEKRAVEIRKLIREFLEATGGERSLSAIQAAKAKQRKRVSEARLAYENASVMAKAGLYGRTAPAEADLKELWKNFERIQSEAEAEEARLSQIERAARSVLEKARQLA